MMPSFFQFFDRESCTYTYLLSCSKTKEAVIIDPVKEHFERDLSWISELGLQLKYCLETHIHADHTTSSGKLAERLGAKVGVSHAAAMRAPCELLSENDEIVFGNHMLRVIETPGHTHSCLSFYMSGKVFTGDALLIHGAGRTDFQEGSSEQLFKSIREKLFTLPDETLVYPAHDYLGRCWSTLAQEKKFNPRIGLNKSLIDFVEIMKTLKLDPPRKINESVPANLRLGLD